MVKYQHELALMFNASGQMLITVDICIGSTADSTMSGRPSITIGNIRGTSALCSQTSPNTNRAGVI